MPLIPHTSPAPVPCPTSPVSLSVHIRCFLLSTLSPTCHQLASFFYFANSAQQFSSLESLSRLFPMYPFRCSSPAHSGIVLFLHHKMRLFSNRYIHVHSLIGRHNPWGNASSLEPQPLAHNLEHHSYSVLIRSDN
jgi:hypothetical protein